MTSGFSWFHRCNIDWLCCGI